MSVLYEKYCITYNFQNILGFFNKFQVFFILFFEYESCVIPIYSDWWKLYLISPSAVLEKPILPLLPLAWFHLFAHTFPEPLTDRQTGSHQCSARHHKPHHSAWQSSSAHPASRASSSSPSHRILSRAAPRAPIGMSETKRQQCRID